MHDDRTPALALKLPHPDNQLQEDVLRLREAIAALDAACAALAEGKASTQDMNSAVAGMQSSLNNLGVTITFIANTKVGVVNGLPGPAVTLKPVHLGLGPANGPSLQTITRDGLGRIATLSTTVGGQVALQTLAYDAEGRLATVVTVYDGRTRTETLNYTGGALSGLTAVEEITP